MSNHPTIAALKIRLESEREKLATLYDNESKYEGTYGGYLSGHNAATERLVAVIEKAVEMATYYANDLPYKESIETMNYCGDDCPVGCNEHSFDHKVKTRAVAHSKEKAREFLTTLADASGEVKNES